MYKLTELKLNNYIKIFDNIIYIFFQSGSFNMVDHSNKEKMVEHCYVLLIDYHYLFPLKK